MYGGEKRCRLGVVENLKEQKPYRRPRNRRECDIKMHFKEIFWEGLD